MLPEHHKERHIFLHRCLDELLADYIAHNPKDRVTQMPLLKLLEWSYQQTLSPKELENEWEL